MIAVSRENALIISGNGDVVESDDEVMAIGSGGPYALAAARALIRRSGLTAPEIVREAMDIAADICVYTNKNITLEEIDTEEEEGPPIKKNRLKKRLNP